MNKNKLHLLLLIFLFIVLYWLGDSVLQYLCISSEAGYWQGVKSKEFSQLCLTDMSSYTLASRLFVSILAISGIVAFKCYKNNLSSCHSAMLKGFKHLFWCIDAKGTVHTSATYDHLLGPIDKTHCLSHFLTSIHDDDRERVQASISSFLSKTTPLFQETFRIHHHHDTTIWLQVISYNIPIQATGRSYQIGMAEDVTEYKNIENALHESETQHHLLFEKMNSAFALHEMIYDSTGKPIDYIFKQINPMFEKMTGLNAEEILDKTVKTVLPDIEESWISTYAKVAVSGDPISFTNYNASLKRYFEVSAFCPRPGYFACTFHDITERINAENRIKENESRFRTILENMPIMLDAFDENNNAVFWNKECERVTGYNADEVLNNNIIWQLLYPNKKYREELMNKAKNTEFNFRNMEWDIITKSNKKRHLLWSNISKSHPIPGWKYWAVGIDVTDRKSIEMNLKQQLEMERIVASVAKRFAADSGDQQAKRDIYWALKQIGMFFNVQHGVLFLANKTGKRVYIANEWCAPGLESYKKHFRYLSGKVSNEFSPEEPLLSWEKVKQFDSKQYFKTKCQDYWEEEKIKSVLLIPIFRQQAFIGFIILESLKSQNSLDTNMASLIQLFAELVADLVERIKIRNELTEAKNQAIESDRLKTEFLANISHEIRTPLNGILGFIEIIANQDFTQESKEEYLKIINNCAQQLVSLISDLIDISKISCGQLEVNTLPVAINLELQRLLEVYSERKSHMSKDSIKLICTKPLPDKKAVIETDILRFHQILNNLLANALKFTDEGFIEFGYAPHPKNFIMFYVKDTGIGIPDKMQKLVFDRFTQVDGSHKRKFSGTGLGLHICKQLLGIMDGEIWVESEENKGTTFFFTLPYTLTELDSEEDNDLDDHGITPQKWTDKTILIVDDIPYLHIQMKEIFDKTGAKLLNAYNGEEAIEICEKESSIDLLLMDIQMPGMSGIDAIRDIKKLSPNVPIIAQTAHAIAGDKERFIKTGFDDYIAKPFRKGEIISKVAPYLS